jgi:hypothetical protein
MRGHTKPSGHTAHSKRRSPTEILHARMPPDAGEAGHGPKSDTHRDCGNYEKHGESRLRASASRTVNRPRTTTGHMRRSRVPLAVVLLPSLRSIRFCRPARARPASGRRDLKPHFPRWRAAGARPCPVREARNVDDGTTVRKTRAAGSIGPYHFAYARGLPQPLRFNMPAGPDETDDVALQLSREEAIAIMRSGLGEYELRLVTSFCAPIYWVVGRKPDRSPIARNGTAFFLDPGPGVFGVTASHVIRGWTPVAGNSKLRRSGVQPLPPRRPPGFIERAFLRWSRPGRSGCTKSSTTASGSSADATAIRYACSLAEATTGPAGCHGSRKRSPSSG